MKDNRALIRIRLMRSAAPIAVAAMAAFGS